MFRGEFLRDVYYKPNCHRLLHYLIVLNLSFTLFTTLFYLHIAHMAHGRGPCKIPNDT